MANKKANGNEIPQHEVRLAWFRCTNCQDSWTKIVPIASVIERRKDEDEGYATRIIDGENTTILTCPTCQQKKFIKPITPEKYEFLQKGDYALFPPQASTPDMFEGGEQTAKE